jgi:hypothetical protein
MNCPDAVATAELLVATDHAVDHASSTELEYHGIA